MIYLSPHFEARNTVSPLPLFELRWRSTWGGQHQARQSAVKLLPSYLVYAERRCTQKGEGVQQLQPEAIWYWTP